MAKFGDDFKFPDEVEDKKDEDKSNELEISIEGEEEEVKVKVVDDTPIEDRNFEPLPEEIAETLETADESNEYGRKVREKFSQYKRAWHDERREKEAALREQQEALRAAQQILDENKRLKGMLQKGETELITNYQASAELEVDKAERNYKEAYDSGDADKLLEAQKELMRAEMKLDKAKNFKPTVQIQENDVQTTQNRPQPEPQMDPKVANWVSKNPWFVSPAKRAMRMYAEGVHAELAERYGKAYIGTDKYFESIDKEVQRRFPEEFSMANEEVEKPQRTRQNSVVAPAKRSTAPKQVVLSKSQVALAKKLGLTNEQYARAMTKMEA
jgi:hypothetical protein